MRPLLSAAVAAAVLAAGCAASHQRPIPEGQERPQNARSLDGGARASVADTGPDGATSGDAGAEACPPLPAGCRPAPYAPTIGEQPYCRADHAWVPALAAQWGITRHVAHDRCTRWVVCDGIGRPCFHCANASGDSFTWTGGWCG